MAWLSLPNASHTPPGALPGLQKQMKEGHQRGKLHAKDLLNELRAAKAGGA